MPQELAIITGIIAALGVICSAFLGVALWRRNKRLDAQAAQLAAKLDAQAAQQAAKQECAVDTNLQADIRYIMRGVDDIKLDQRAMREDMNGMKERITRVEEKASSAHKRLDEHIREHPLDRQ